LYCLATKARKAFWRSLNDLQFYYILKMKILEENYFCLFKIHEMQNKHEIAKKQLHNSSFL